jgi:peptide/nickel transport system ATP-binding protein
MGVIFITHDLGVIAEIAEKVVVMYKGSIVEKGEKTEVLQQPREEYTRTLLTVNNYLKQENEQKIKTTNDEVLIEVRNLSVAFPAKKSFIGRPTAYNVAVDNVSFDVCRGETLGLVGESGCGKTTLGRTLLRLTEPTSGTIRYDGLDLLSLSGASLRKFRKKMQIIFQDPYSSLNPSQTIGSAIAEPLKVHFPELSAVERKSRVAQLLEKVRLEPSYMNRYPHEFSGGQRQRIVIARALALQPEFIVCDESVSALDVSVQAQVLQLLNDLKKEFGYTCIFISHDLSVVRFVSNRIMVMHRGRIEELGETEQVYGSPTSPYTRKLLESIPKSLPLHA